RMLRLPFGFRQLLARPSAVPVMPFALLPRRPLHSTLLTLASLLGVGAMLVACSDAKGPQGSSQQAVEVGVVQLAEAALPVETVLPGRTVALQRADIRP